jgi:hypothetical protein
MASVKVRLPIIGHPSSRPKDQPVRCPLILGSLNPPADVLGLEVVYEPSCEKRHYSERTAMVLRERCPWEGPGVFGELARSSRA